MLVNRNSTLTLSGILIIALLKPMAWGEVGTTDWMPAQAYSVASEIRQSPETGSGIKSGDAENSAVFNLSGESTPHARFGDGRIGFWVIGILINLSVLGWFLWWALKEWRKKGGD
ncbi:MAG: hypothetical protein H6964_03850 [Chromatiaceae bacterium]|nr:hypothetical protein [Gammaproteobacteria bacterium]MCB1870574.1 hypothetical protein [Gammaproteobacteria bacterium]MCB1881476.1 hypothetical protein [Gammaproteobacteria bacterium]MCP5428366.1 hypothetical protein [Chromatiaceae bacterium]MCP5446117.1 hypothetical protein [Chromatiaceae bacterium]